MTAGIYMIVNTVNNKFYIGSSKNLEKRFEQHISQLEKNLHHNVLLQRSYIKYTHHKFNFIIIESVSNEEVTDDKYLLDLEQTYISSVNCEFNIKDNTQLTEKEINIIQENNKMKAYKRLAKGDDFVCLNKDFSWVNKFDNATQFKVFFLLFDYENTKDNCVYVNETVKTKIAKDINLTLNSVTLAIKQLVENDCIIRVKRGVYKVNPYIIYQGGTATVNNKRLMYDENKYDNNMYGCQP